LTSVNILIGSNNAAARLKTINTILYIYSDSNCLFYYLQSSNIGQLLAIIIFYAFEMKLTFSERKINKKYGHHLLLQDRYIVSQYLKVMDDMLDDSFERSDLDNFIWAIANLALILIKTIVSLVILSSSLHHSSEVIRSMEGPSSDNMSGAVVLRR
jgi:hypothetical protein